MLCTSMDHRERPSKPPSTSLRSRFSSLSLKVKKVFAKPPAASATPAPSADHVPTLPLDIIALVVDQILFRRPRDEQRRACGLRIALVCRDWRPLGEGLVWAKVDVNSPEKARGLVEQFKAAPSLAHAVRELSFGGGHPDFDEEDPARLAAAHDVVAILSACRSLRQLGIFGAYWFDIGRLLRCPPALPTVASFKLRYRDADLDPASLLHFLASLPRLQDLFFCVLNAYTPLDRPFTPPRLSLRTILAHELNPAPHPFAAHPPCLFGHLLLSLDPHYLRKITISLDHRDFDFLGRIFAFTSLDKLDLYLSHGQLEPFLRHLWLLAAQHPRPLALRFSFGHPEYPSRLLDLSETPNLVTFLEAIPSTIQTLSLRTIYLRAEHLPEVEEEGDFSRTATVEVELPGQWARRFSFGQREGSTQWVQLKTRIPEDLAW